MCRRKFSFGKYRKLFSYFENRYQHAKIVEKKKKSFFVSPCWNENLKFYEVALVVVYCNCLVSFIMIP